MRYVSLFLIMWCASCTDTLPTEEVHYLDKVTVVCGFNQGREGCVIQKENNGYRIREEETLLYSTFFVNAECVHVIGSCK